jgi:hypothetical protein
MGFLILKITAAILLVWFLITKKRPEPEEHIQWYTCSSGCCESTKPNDHCEFCLKDPIKEVLQRSALKRVCFFEELPTDYQNDEVLDSIIVFGSELYIGVKQHFTWFCSEVQSRLEDFRAEELRKLYLTGFILSGYSTQAAKEAVDRGFIPWEEVSCQ